jgi:2,3-bisphosphoglycerate-independent phosphoglycerate mutase
VILGDDGKPQGLIKDNDALISFNHRSDRPREIIRAIFEDTFEQTTAKDPDPGWNRGARPKNLHLVTMTDYRAGFKCPVAFESQELKGTLAEVVSKAGLKQFHTAETEKYPHVTFFFNGGREAPWDGEERFMANSPKVATYDLQPEMSAAEITTHACAAIRSKKYDLLILNFANGDMVGHTGVEAAAIKAVETVDHCVGELVQALSEVGGEVLITADHGNAEQMWDDENNCPHTAHTTNPVPCVLVSERFKKAKLREGRLADVAPTLLQLLGLKPSPEMNGQSLIVE